MAMLLKGVTKSGVLTRALSNSFLTVVNISPLKEVVNNSFSSTSLIDKYLYKKTVKLLFWHGCGFSSSKIENMKKTIFVLPLCLFFAFCSSSRKATTPASPGISNVNVSRGDTMTSASVASASFSSDQRDWAYKGTRDNTLSGRWTLDGMMGPDGNWQSASSGIVSDSALSVMPDTTSMAGTANSNAKGKSSNKALYEESKKRLNMQFRDSTVRDTTTQAYKYWTRTPTLIINAQNLVFTGNTGCNSMSGKLNFDEKDIQFDRNIITSKMMCNDYDETAFLSALKKADSYSVNGDRLELKQGNSVLLSFVKS